MIYKPDHFHHPLNDKGYRGYVYEHRYVVECAIGRALKSDEIVHHKDGNKLNNDKSNLTIMTRAGHLIEHIGRRKISYCVDCGKELSDSRSVRCRECCKINSRKVKNRPSKEELAKMVRESSYCEVGRMFGVSDNTVRKWLK